MGLDTQLITNGVKIADLWVISIFETKSATIKDVVVIMAYSTQL